MNLMTIIIPMYNEQNNIVQCVTTLINQTNQNFNIVFIDDGSTDNTLHSLEEHLSNQEELNYIIIKQSNKGAAEARRIGIERALTDYIMFYDCDDLLSDNMIETFYSTYHEHKDADIIIPRMQIQNKDNTWREFEFFSDQKVLNSLECVKNSLNGWKIHGCFAIKKKIILKSYKDYYGFNPKNMNYINNDEVITRLNFLNSEKIVRNDAVYYYCNNSLSTTKRINPRLYLSINNAFILYNIFSSYSYISKDSNAELVSTIWGNLVYMNKHRHQLKNFKNWQSNIRKSTQSIDFLKIFKKSTLKTKIQMFILITLNSFNLI